MTDGIVAILDGLFEQSARTTTALEERLEKHVNAFSTFVERQQLDNEQLADIIEHLPAALEISLQVKLEKRSTDLAALHVSHYRNETRVLYDRLNSIREALALLSGGNTTDTVKLVEDVLYKQVPSPLKEFENSMSKIVSRVTALEKKKKK